jgi:hypothetical protein
MWITTPILRKISFGAIFSPICLDIALKSDDDSGGEGDSHFLPFFKDNYIKKGQRI